MSSHGVPAPPAPPGRAAGAAGPRSRAIGGTRGARSGNGTTGTAGSGAPPPEHWGASASKDKVYARRAKHRHNYEKGRYQPMSDDAVSGPQLAARRIRQARHRASDQHQLQLAGGADASGSGYDGDREGVSAWHRWAAAPGGSMLPASSTVAAAHDAARRQLAGGLGGTALTMAGNADAARDHDGTDGGLAAQQVGAGMRVRHNAESVRSSLAAPVARGVGTGASHSYHHQLISLNAAAAATTSGVGTGAHHDDLDAVAAAAGHGAALYASAVHVGTAVPNMNPTASGPAGGSSLRHGAQQESEPDSKPLAALLQVPPADPAAIAAATAAALIGVEGRVAAVKAAEEAAGHGGVPIGPAPPVGHPVATPARRAPVTVPTPQWRPKGLAGTIPEHGSNAAAAAAALGAGGEGPTATTTTGGSGAGATLSSAPVPAPKSLATVQSRSGSSGQGGASGAAGTGSGGSPSHIDTSVGAVRVAHITTDDTDNYGTSYMHHGRVSPRAALAATAQQQMGDDASLNLKADEVSAASLVGDGDTVQIRTVTLHSGGRSDAEAGFGTATTTMRGGTATTVTQRVSTAVRVDGVPSADEDGLAGSVHLYYRPETVGDGAPGSSSNASDALTVLGNQGRASAGARGYRADIMPAMPSGVGAKEARGAAVLRAADGTAVVIRKAAPYPPRSGTITSAAARHARAAVPRRGTMVKPQQPQTPKGMFRDLAGLDPAVASQVVRRIVAHQSTRGGARPGGSERRRSSAAQAVALAAGQDDRVIVVDDAQSRAVDVNAAASRMPPRAPSAPQDSDRRAASSNAAARKLGPSTPRFRTAASGTTHTTSHGAQTQIQAASRGQSRSSVAVKFESDMAGASVQGGAEPDTDDPLRPEPLSPRSRLSGAGSRGPPQTPGSELSRALSRAMPSQHRLGASSAQSFSAIMLDKSMPVPKTAIPERFWARKQGLLWSELSVAPGADAVYDDAAARRFSTVQYPAAKPSNRSEVRYLERVLDLMLDEVYVGVPMGERGVLEPEIETMLEAVHNPEESDADQALVGFTPQLSAEIGVWSVVLFEIVRQVFVHCEDRGALLERCRVRLLQALEWADERMAALGGAASEAVLQFRSVAAKLEAAKAHFKQRLDDIEAYSAHRVEQLARERDTYKHIWQAAKDVLEEKTRDLNAERMKYAHRSDMTMRNALVGRDDTSGSIHTTDTGTQAFMPKMFLKRQVALPPGVMLPKEKVTSLDESAKNRVPMRLLRRQKLSSGVPLVPAMNIPGMNASSASMASAVRGMEAPGMHAMSSMRSIMSETATSVAESGTDGGSDHERAGSPAPSVGTSVGVPQRVGKLVRAASSLSTAGSAMFSRAHLRPKGAPPVDRAGREMVEVAIDTTGMVILSRAEFESILAQVSRQAGGSAPVVVADAHDDGAGKSCICRECGRKLGLKGCADGTIEDVGGEGNDADPEPSGGDDVPKLVRAKKWRGMDLPEWWMKVLTHYKGKARRMGVRPMVQLCFHVYQAKIKADVKAKDPHSVDTLAEYVTNWMLYKYGTKSLVQRRLASLVVCMRDYSRRGEEVSTLFVRFCGMSIPQKHGAPLDPLPNECLSFTLAALNVAYRGEMPVMQIEGTPDVLPSMSMIGRGALEAIKAVALRCPMANVRLAENKLRDCLGKTKDGTGPVIEGRRMSQVMLAADAPGAPRRRRSKSKVAAAGSSSSEDSDAKRERMVARDADGSDSDEEVRVLTHADIAALDRSRRSTRASLGKTLKVSASRRSMTGFGADGASASGTSADDSDIGALGPRSRRASSKMALMAEDGVSPRAAAANLKRRKSAALVMAAAKAAGAGAGSAGGAAGAAAAAALPKTDSERRAEKKIADKAKTAQSQSQMAFAGLAAAASSKRDMTTSLVVNTIATDKLVNNATVEGTNAGFIASKNGADAHEVAAIAAAAAAHAYNRLSSEPAKPTAAAAKSGTRAGVHVIHSRGLTAYKSIAHFAANTAARTMDIRSTGREVQAALRLQTMFRAHRARQEVKEFRRSLNSQLSLKVDIVDFMQIVVEMWEGAHERVLGKVVDLFTEHDEDGNGSLDYKEFVNLCDATAEMLTPDYHPRRLPHKKTQRVFVDMSAEAPDGKVDLKVYCDLVHQRMHELFLNPDTDEGVDDHTDDMSALFEQQHHRFAGMGRPMSPNSWKKARRAKEEASRHNTPRGSGKRKGKVKRGRRRSKAKLRVGVESADESASTSTSPLRSMRSARKGRMYDRRAPRPSDRSPKSGSASEAT